MKFYLFHFTVERSIERLCRPTLELRDDLAVAAPRARSPAPRLGIANEWHVRARTPRVSVRSMAVLAPADHAARVEAVEKLLARLVAEAAVGAGATPAKARRRP